MFWKRGFIYWGFFGNGKMISIKVMMKMFSEREEKVLLLYVRNFVLVSFFCVIG